MVKYSYVVLIRDPYDSRDNRNIGPFKTHEDACWYIHNCIKSAMGERYKPGGTYKLFLKAYDIYKIEFPFRMMITYLNFEERSDS